MLNVPASDVRDSTSGDCKFSWDDLVFVDYDPSSDVCGLWACDLSACGRGLSGGRGWGRNAAQGRGDYLVKRWVGTVLMPVALWLRVSASRQSSVSQPVAGTRLNLRQLGYWQQPMLLQTFPLLHENPSCLRKLTGCYSKSAYTILQLMCNMVSQVGDRLSSRGNTGVCKVLINQNRLLILAT